MNIKDFISQRKLIKHNKRIFSELKIKKKKNYNFLIEFNAFHYHHLILSYIVNFFKDKFRCNFYSYPSHALLSYPIENSFLKRIKILFLKILNIGNYGVYQSFGIKDFIEFKVNNKVIQKTNNFLKSAKLNNKNDIVKLKVNKILIGDLLYDTYLKKYRLEIPTIDINSKHFHNFLKEFINLFFIWDEIIKKKKINFFLISHIEYSMGLPARICVHKGGSGLLIEFDKLTKINKDNIYHNSASKYYKKKFLKFSKINRKKFAKIGKKKLLERLSGSTKDIPYMTKSAYTNNLKNKKTVRLKNYKKGKTKILIATHDFVDAPHVDGKFVFSDMVEWIRFLVNFSKKTDYIWYIKNHPSMNDKWKSYQYYTRNVVNKLIRNSNLILLNSNTSHNEIINQIKIDCVLTVWGRIAHEYASKNITVVNASYSNIHSSFNFNFHAKNIKEYVYFLKNFMKLKKNLRYDEVNNFYFMHYIYSDKDWFFQDIDKFIKQIGGYHNLWSTKIYEHWIKNYNLKFKKKFDAKLEKFINSDNLNLIKDNYLF